MRKRYRQLQQTLQAYTGGECRKTRIETETLFNFNRKNNLLDDNCGQEVTGGGASAVITENRKTIARCHLRSIRLGEEELVACQRPVWRTTPHMLRTPPGAQFWQVVGRPRNRPPWRFRPLGFLFYPVCRLFHTLLGS